MGKQQSEQTEVQDTELLATDNEPEVTGETQFQRRGFAPAEGDSEGEGSEPEALMDAPEYDGSEVTEEEAEVPETEDEQPQKIKIGDRWFATQKEAFDYAAELEREKLAADAFRQGVEAAQGQPQGNTQPAPEPEEDFDQEFYANPKEYLKKVKEQAKAELKQELTTEQQKRQTHERTWNEFYTDYPDLQNSKVLVNALLQQNWGDLQQLETKKALKILAERARAEKRAMIEAELPRTELGDRKRTTSSGGSVNVTPKKVDGPSLNFASQIRNNKMKRAQRV